MRLRSAGIGLTFAFGLNHLSMVAHAESAPTEQAQPYQMVRTLQNIQDEIIARAREIGAAFVAKPVTGDSLENFLSGASLRLRSAKA